MHWSPLIISDVALWKCKKNLMKMYLNILNDNTDEYCINKVIEEGYSFNWICFYKDYTFNRIPTRLIVKWQQPQYSLQTEYIFAIKVEGNYYPVILDNNEFKCISKLIII